MDIMSLNAANKITNNSNGNGMKNSETLAPGVASRNRWMLGRSMGRMGFIASIIEIEAGLTRRQVRRLLDELEEENALPKTTGRQLRSGATLINNINSQMQASLFMGFYINFASKNPMTTIDIYALVSAYRQFMRVRKEIPGLVCGTPQWKFFNINDAWSFAQELRNQEARMENCRKCSIWFFTSDHQRTRGECPFCKAIERQQSNPEQSK